MEMLGTSRSVAAWLDRTARIAFFLAMLGTVVAAVSPILLFARSEGETAAISLPVVVHPSTERGSQTLLPRTDAFDDGKLIVLSGILEYRPGSVSALAVVWLTDLLGLGLWLLILHRLKGITGTLRAGQPFVGDNAERIRTIGFAVCASWLVGRLSQLAIQYFARRHFVYEGGTFSWFVEPAVGVLFLGLLVLAIAEVFRVGASLQQEHDTTI